MKSLTIYLHQDDFEKVKQITKQRKITVAQFYRDLTQLGFLKHDQGKEYKNEKRFCGFPEDY